MPTLSTDRPTTVSVDPRLIQLIEEAAQRLQAGESVDLTELVEEHPSYSDALRQLLPTIATLVGMGESQSVASFPRSMQVGSYQLVAKLGSGGMGTVYMAVHSELQKTVAIKLLSGNRIQDSQSAARFQREMQAIGKFDHPNIVRATDAGRVDDIHFLVMEYLDGINLANLVRRCGPLRVADACEIIRQAAEGIEFIHQHGLVHRDIKPSNLMLTKDGRVKILDLGLARLSSRRGSGESELTGPGQLIGTFVYMAPEQGSEDQAINTRTDIYSLGATFFHLLAGKAPFACSQHETPLKKLIALAAREAPAIVSLRVDLPPTLAPIVSRMLANDANARFATAAEVASALEPLSRGSDLVGLLVGVTSNSEGHELSPVPVLARGSRGSAAVDPNTAERSSGAVEQIAERADRIAPKANEAGRHSTAIDGPPSRRWMRNMMAAASVPLFVAGVILLVRDGDGKEKARLELAAGDKLEIVQPDGPAETTEVSSTNHDILPVQPSEKFQIFAPACKPESITALENLLRRENKRANVSIIEALAEVKVADPAVLIVAMNQQAFLDVGEYDPQALKERKVIGIGDGAAKLFGELGLDINWGACAHGVHGAPRITVLENKLLSDDRFRSPMFVFDPPVLDEKNFHNELFFGVYVGEKKPRRRAEMEIIALQTADPNYAPVARQGNHILVCVDAPANQWSDAFQSLMQSLAAALDSHEVAAENDRAAADAD